MKAGYPLHYLALTLNLQTDTERYYDISKFSHGKCGLYRLYVVL